MRASVSDIEAYRRWREDPDAELAELLAQLRGQWPDSPRRSAGSAFHRALELAEPGEFEQLQADGHVFLIDAEIEIELPEVREVRASRTWQLPDGPLTLSGQVDAISGSRVDDHKTTVQMDAEGYLAGYPWRLYLELFGADTFRWNVFEMRQVLERELSTLPGLPAGRTYLIHAAHRLEQHRYPGMAQDCTRLLADFQAFARAHLPERCCPPPAWLGQRRPPHLAAALGRPAANG